VKTRVHLAVLAGLIFALPLAAEAQRSQEPKSAKIGFLLGGTPSSPTMEFEPFKQTLREKGWIEGQNLALEYRYAQGYYERLPALARELIGLGVDAIVTEGTPPTLAAMQATKTVPIVVAASADSVGSGLVGSLARPGGNVTGSSIFQSEISAKRIELLKETAPHIERVAVVYNPLNRVQEPTVVAIEAAARRFKIRIQRLAVRAPADVDAVLHEITLHKVDAVTVMEDQMINSQALRIANAALKERVPAVFGLSSVAAAGGFMSYAPSRLDLWRRAAELTDKILRGAKPGDLPVEQPTTFELVITLKTAKALGITIPQSILLRADRVIE